MDISKEENPVQPGDRYMEKDIGGRWKVRTMNLKHNLSFLSYSWDSIDRRKKNTRGKEVPVHILQTLDLYCSLWC